MLRVPLLRQPDDVSCLPACVWSVLTYAGNQVDYEAIEAACRLDQFGAVQELAIQALREAGWDVEVLDGFELETIRLAIQEDRPLILCLDLGNMRPRRFLHAVVVCDLAPRSVRVMDPALGAYVDLPLESVRHRAGTGLTASFFIGGPPQT